MVPRCLFTLSLSSFSLRLGCQERGRRGGGGGSRVFSSSSSSSSPTTSELPAGSELFYALVVTGRFIRLEICTNQLSFSGSCQCVKLSGPAVRKMPEGAERGGNRPEKENEFKQT